ncbi:gliding motility protein GldM [Prolixibacteraceae bacterium JC049]|nr:gliding motility protein GldM [Prolixibacteraceae bacterium JC049]
MGGAKLCPETPRQKMINMMYIVLTAMLALNVAEEVLLSFKVVDSSLQQTITNFELKNAQVYNAFEQAARENPQKVDEWNSKAKIVKEQSQKITNAINQLKIDLVQYSGHKKIDYKEGSYLKPDDAYIIDFNGDTLQLKKQDDLNTPSELMLTKNRAEKLKEDLGQYKDVLLAMVDERNLPLRNTIVQNLDTSDPKHDARSGKDPKTWETGNFENKPLIAIITLLSKMQIDVRNSESNVLNYLFGQIDASSFKFTGLEAKIIAKSNYVLEGGLYEAEIFLTAVDSTMSPEIFIGNQKMPVRNGKGIYRIKANSVGKKKISGIIKYPNPLGGFNSYPFDTEYEVARPSYSIAPTKMNVFYIGVPNPIDVSVAGVSMSNIELDMTNGTIEEVGDQLVVRPKDEDITGEKTLITVFANVDGKRQEMGSMKWRVKQVPDPVAKIGGKKGGVIRKEELLVEDGIAAVLEDFDFDLKFRVTSFEMHVIGAGGYTNKWTTQGNRFTNDQKAQIRRLTSGSDIYFRNITAKGDDGTTRELSTIALRVR